MALYREHQTEFLRRLVLLICMANKHLAVVCWCQVQTTSLEIMQPLSQSASLNA